MSRALSRAARALEDGELVGYPTDTLYGLAALATDRAAVERLVRLKGRAPGQPISIACSSFEEIEPFAELSGARRSFLRTHLPGPYTVLLPPRRRALEEFAPEVAREGAAIGIRIPDHPLARELARRVGPITATSANRHGEAPARTAKEARAALGGGVSVYLPSIPAPAGTPSTIVDLTGSAPAWRSRK